jgi:hypothetical protein
MHAGKAADDLEMAQFLGCPSGGLFAPDPSNSIPGSNIASRQPVPRSRRQIARGACCRARVRLVNSDSVHKFFDVVIHDIFSDAVGARRATAPRSNRVPARMFLTANAASAFLSRAPKSRGSTGAPRSVTTCALPQYGRAGIYRWLPRLPGSASSPVLAVRSYPLPHKSLREGSPICVSRNIGAIALIAQRPLLLVLAAQAASRFVIQPLPPSFLWRPLAGTSCALQRLCESFLPENVDEIVQCRK